MSHSASSCLSIDRSLMCTGFRTGVSLLFCEEVAAETSNDRGRVLRKKKGGDDRATTKEEDDNIFRTPNEAMEVVVPSNDEPGLLSFRAKNCAAGCIATGESHLLPRIPEPLGRCKSVHVDF
jgi:hypothetical protein